MADDAQAEAGAPGRPGAAPVEAVETLENPLPRPLGNAPAVVGYGEDDPLALVGGGEGDLHKGVGLGVLLGVFHEIGEDLLEEDGINLGVEGLRRQGQAQGGPAVPAADRLDLRKVADLLLQAAPLPGEPPLLVLEPGKGKEILHEAVQALRVPVDLLREGLPLLGAEVLAILVEGLRETLDDRDGGAQLVGYVGDEFPPDRLQPLQAGDVVEEEEGPLPRRLRRGRAQGSPGNLQPDLGPVREVELEGAALDAMAAADVRKETEKVRVVEESLDATARQRLPPQEEAVGRTVRQEDPVAPVHHEHPFHHVTKGDFNLFHLGGAPLEGPDPLFRLGAEEVHRLGNAEGLGEAVAGEEEVPLGGDRLPEVAVQAADPLPAHLVEDHDEDEEAGEKDGEQGSTRGDRRPPFRPRG